MRTAGLPDLLGEFELPAGPALPPIVPGQGTPGPTEITPPGQPDVYTAGATIDDLLKQAEQGKPVGPSQRYFKPGPAAPPQAPPQPAPQAPEPLAPRPGETEKEMIDRMLGRKRGAMNLGATLTDLANSPLSGWTGRPEDTQTYGEILKRLALPELPREPMPDPGALLLDRAKQEFLRRGPAVNRQLHDLFGGGPR